MLSSLSRRGLLAGGALASCTVVLPAAAKVSRFKDPAVQAWNAYRDAVNLCDDAMLDPKADTAPLCAERDRLEGRLCTVQPSTPAGCAALLRWSLELQCYDLWALNLVFDRARPEDYRQLEMADLPLRTMWRTIETLEAMP